MQVRLKCPDGAVTPQQLRAVGKIAEGAGGGAAELTERQEIQLELPGQSLPDALAALGEVGLRPDEAEAEFGAAAAAPAGPGEDRFGVHEQEQAGVFSVMIPLPGGRMTAAQMRKAADLAERHGNGAIRFTLRRNLKILNLPQEKVAQVMEGLGSVDLRATLSERPRPV